MRISIFLKTFLILLISFSLVFFLSMAISIRRFSPLYIEENVESVKSSILESITLLQNGAPLDETTLSNLSSETSFIRFSNTGTSESIGPSYLAEDDVIDFVISIYDNPDAIKDGSLTYTIELVDDIYHINYIYQFDLGDYLIIYTKIQSLQNVDRVLNQINITQSIFVFIAILLLSLVISVNLSSPIKKISLYAKDISELKFSKKLTLKRRDEFKDLISSLNEMTFNLKKTYSELNEANRKLSSDIDFEKEQEEKKKHLIMTINHEIKTPLAVMKGMIEGMIDGVGRYKDRDKYLKELFEQITVIENITQDFTYSLKLEDKMKKGNICSTERILQELKSLDELATLHFIKIDKEIDIVDVMMNEELLIILITNLVKNAILYSQDKNVHVEGLKKEGQFVFTVINKGEIPEAEIDKIFESFYRANPSEPKKSGSGLGLFIVKQIADLYSYSYKIFNDNGKVVAKVIIPIKK
ncbi:MAG: sensor histidine kinase [Acholeplasma sp.]|jgi:two-component system sensor histidine kinase VanS|nr:MAG: sensor histidine kinase [Acholeplasma sp.]